MSGEAGVHYAAVLRALVLESQELKSFLAKISSQDSSAPLDQLVSSDWAKLWIQVVKQLRDGVQLRRVSAGENASRAEYALTPYEMLLEDIRLKNYRLNHVPLDRNDFPHKVKKDAHALILEFIRSRPPLAPASERRLGPKPEKEVSIYEKLMQSIRQKDHKLRPTTTTVKWGSEAALATPALRPQQLEATSLTPGAPRRRLIKANLNLNLNTSFDDSDDDRTDDTHDDNSEAQHRRRFSLRNRESIDPLTPD